MTILFVYPDVFCPRHGGVERVTDTLAKELIRRGHSVIYLHNKKPNGYAAMYDYPVPMHFFPDEKYLTDDNFAFYKSFLKRFNVDIVINQSGLFGDSQLYCCTDGTRAKCISVLHSAPMRNYDHMWHELYPLRNKSAIEKCKRIARLVLFLKIKKTFKNLLIRHYEWLFKHSDKVCLLSDAFRPQLEKVYSGSDMANKLVSIPNPIDRVDGNDYQKGKTVLFVGRLQMKDKRPDRMIKIWSKVCQNHPDWELLFLGDGPDRQKLEKAASGLPRVSFLGFVNPDKYYARASIVCMTSNYEGWGMVLTESMRYGCVPMAFDSFASLSDIVVTEFQKVKPFDIAAYVEKLDRLMNDESLRNNIIKQQYEHIKNFEIDRVVDRWERLLADVVNE